jgi:2-aminoadipate transaminase
LIFVDQEWCGLNERGFARRGAEDQVSDKTARHLKILERHEARSDAMAAALQASLPPGCRWQAPVGGIHFWVTLPAHLEVTALLPRAVEAGMAYV